MTHSEHSTSVVLDTLVDDTYQQVLSLGAELLDPTSPHDLDSLDAVMRELSAQKEVVVDSLHTEYAESTLTLLNRLLRLGWSEITDVPARHIEEVQNRAASMVFFYFSPHLMSAAEQRPDFPFTPHVASLLFAALARQPHLANDRLTRFVSANISEALDYASQLAASRHTALRDRASKLTYDEQTEAKHVATGLRYLLHVSQDESAKHVMAGIRSLAHTAEVNPLVDDWLQPLLQDREFTAKVCELLGIPHHPMEYAWAIGYGPKAPNYDFRKVYRRQCVRRMLSLEHERPGIVRTLYREFGIRNFARYSEQLLLDIYDERNKEAADKLLAATTGHTQPAKKERRAYLLAAVADCDGSATRNSMPKLEELYWNLRTQGIKVSVIEYGTGRELGVRARQAERLGFEPALLVASDSHALGNELTAGSESLLTQDVIDWLGILAAKATRPDATIFLNACSLGRDDDGFAATLHQVSERTVLASSGCSFLGDIRATINQKGTASVTVNLCPSSKVDTDGPPPLRRFESAGERCQLFTVNDLRAAA
ncbi:MAG TPA: hypothetical protein VJ836_02500 [Candidatus Saccharimonadales bacterium]|nr:hypothetical protein [Candidatus Saccharimonadales bacterium]